MRRLALLRKTLVWEKIDGFLVTDFYNLGYLSHFWGLSLKEREAYLLITQKQAFLLTDGRYLEAAKKLKTGFRCLEITPQKKVFSQIGNLGKKLKIHRLGFEKSSLTFAEYEALKRSAKQVTPASRLVATGNLGENLRAVKEPREIAAIKKAVTLTDQTFSHLLKVIKPGLSELEVSWEIEKFLHENGAAPAFAPIVAFGLNSSIPHHQTSDQRLKTNDIVLLDFGAKVQNYCSDMTRVVFLGKATEEQKKVYQMVLEAQKVAIEHLGGGRMDSSEVDPIKANVIDKIARSYITSHGYPSIPHGLGHGVGLSPHELPILSPKSKDILKPGMVFTVEPGIYLPQKFGIRIEDLVLLTKSGPQILTRSLKEIITL